MSESLAGLSARVQERFGDAIRHRAVATGELCVEVAAPNLLAVCAGLRDEEGFEFAQLVDLCGVDYLGYGQADWQTSETVTASGFSRGVEARVYDDDAAERPRFAVVYHLLSHALNQRLRLRCWCEGEPPRVESVVGLWHGAEWFEREAFDLFGILFDGHPDLRRILTDYGFVGHPFRKDFPLIGEVEMRYDPERRRVVYEPVTIEARTLVPRVIRHDGRDPDEADAAVAPDGDRTGG